jgi:tetratricopeptide (TPR) repeat protein
MRDRDGVRHSGSVGKGSRAVALTVLSVAVAAPLGYEAGIRAGTLAGVLASLAGFVPAMVWELVRGWRERSARARETREAAERGARLLRPEAAVVGFRPRRELDELADWCAAGDGVGVRLVTGEGGSGKTRLALQLAADLAVAGWRTLWVERGQEQTAVGTVRDTGKPAVLVVDYAETRPGLAGMLTGAVRAQDCPDLRIVLLARTAGEWWQQLLAGADYRLSQVLEQAPPLTLGPLADAGGQQDLFDEAVTAFAGRLGVTRPDARLLLDDPDAVVLVVHAAALLAVLDDATADGSGPARMYSAGEVLTGLLGHEARYWHKSAVARRLVLDTEVQRLAVAVACLAGAGSETEAAALLAHVPDLAGSAERRGQVARWLHALYPASAGGGTCGGWLGTLRPDRVAEHLVTGELDRRRELVPGLLAGLDHDRLVRALTVLGRAARDDNRAARLLRGAVEGDLEHLAVPALTVATETNPDVADMLTSALTSAPAPKSVLEHIAAALPYPTFALAGTAVEVFRQLAAEAAAGSSERARLLILFSNSLGDLGRREEALAAIEEAVTTYRTLAQGRPDTFLPDLAASLNNQSGRLSELGRRKEALAAIEEAVTVYRILAQGRPDTYLPDLAASLNNLAPRLSGLGRREEALAAIEEAVTIYRTLAQTHPDAFLPDLAGSLNNQSGRLSELGRREEALAAIEEAVTVRRTLAQAHPDAFLPDLAASLNNLAPRLSGLGRREEALAAIEEAVTVYRTLAQGHPDAFLPDLAGSLNNQSGRLSELGRREEALAAIEEAVTVRRTLAQAHPDAFLPDLAGSLNNLALRLSGLGRREKALAAIKEAVTVRRTLAKARPAVFTSRYANSLEIQATILSELGRDAEARTARDEAATVRGKRLTRMSDS